MANSKYFRVRVLESLQRLFEASKPHAIRESAWWTNALPAQQQRPLTSSLMILSNFSVSHSNCIHRVKMSENTKTTWNLFLASF